MKVYRHRYYGKLFKFIVDNISVGDIIHIYLGASSFDDFRLKLNLMNIQYEVENEG